MDFDTTAANAILDEAGPEAALVALRDKVMEMRLTRPNDPLLEMLALFLAEFEDPQSRSVPPEDRNA